ncbi:hypothetical protein C1H46_007746 [Malus baccata]|uniref:Glycosyltransferase n=1 Tax=Malus baccata TaxID=106549 RepID=A0A540N848_MALBA|nr:hypothetical protein C1H46_007746 [Malus baccata]
MKQPTKLVFIPYAGTGHLISAVEMAKLLVSRDEKLFITVLIMKLPFESKGTEAYISSLESSPVLSRVNFITLPQAASDIDTRKSPNAFRSQFVESHKPYVKDAVSKLAESESESTRVAGFVIDMFCTTMIDVANDFGVPTYMFFASPAGFLGMVLNIQTIRDVSGKHVGPILNLKSSETEVGSKQAQQKSDILEWLDDQPDSSGGFLCFGSMGSFGEDQVREIASGLEQSGHRFLWSLRQPPPKGIIASPSDYSDPKAVLPEGFLDRTAGIGKVIGWAPQVAILAHPAVGGFVSHCGWNSTLESLWFGVPVAAWPVYAEQQLNAFELVRELGLAVEVNMEYRRDLYGEYPNVVKAHELERGIKELMEKDSDVRKRVKYMSEKSKKALMVGGSSYNSLGRFLDQISL